MKYEKPKLYELASALSIVRGIPPVGLDSPDPGERLEGLEVGLDD